MMRSVGRAGGSCGGGSGRWSPVISWPMESSRPPSRTRELGWRMQPPARVRIRRRRRAESLGIEDTVEVPFEAIFLDIGDAAAADVGVLGDVGGVVHGVGQGL